MLGTAVFGIALPESEGVNREANRNELREFLKGPISGQEALRPATAEFLSHLRLTKPSEVGWAHNANNRRRVNAFAKDQNRHVAELDCRFDEKEVYTSLTIEVVNPISILRRHTKLSFHPHFRNL